MLLKGRVLALAVVALVCGHLLAVDEDLYQRARIDDLRLLLDVSFTKPVDSREFMSFMKNSLMQTCTSRIPFSVMSPRGPCTLTSVSTFMVARYVMPKLPCPKTLSIRYL